MLMFHFRFIFFKFWSILELSGAQKWSSSFSELNLLK